MKIRDSSRKPAMEKTFPERKVLRARNVPKEPLFAFQKELQAYQKKQLSQKLKFILGEIDETGEKLVKLRTVNILSQYKELIKGFLKEVVENLYLLKEEAHFDPKGKHKILVSVKTINTNLENLVKMVLDKEVNNLKLLEKVGEIKGMLIDLYS